MIDFITQHYVQSWFLLGLLGLALERLCKVVESTILDKGKYRKITAGQLAVVVLFGPFSAIAFTFTTIANVYGITKKFWNNVFDIELF